MATNIQEALQGAGAVSARPVTMEALPDATIDVSGGSQSLDIEGLGVKRKKNDLSAVTSSTSSLAIEDLFGDLLDNVNFSDPNSVDAFRNSAVSRINEFDSASLSNILGEASTVAGDLATVTTPFLGKDTSQDQFQQVFGPSRVAPDAVESDDLNVGFDTATSTEAQDISSLTNPGLAAGLFGGVLGAAGTGGTSANFATNLGTQALGQADVVGALGGFSSVQSVSNALDRRITDIPSALNAVSAGLGAAQTVARAEELVNSGVTISSIFEKAAKNVGEFVEGIYSAVTNPLQAMEAYGLQMQYGTTTPGNISFNLPSGNVSFNFDAKTGRLVTPGMIPTMLPTPLKIAFGLGQFAMDKTGYTEMISQRARGMSNAFNNVGITAGDGMTAFSGSTPEGDMLALDIDFSNTPGVTYSSLQIDFNALDPDTPISQISYEDLNQASVVQGFPTFDPDFNEQAIMEEAAKEKMVSAAQRFGIDINAPTSKIQDALNEGAREAAEAYQVEIEAQVQSELGMTMQEFNERYGFSQLEQFGLAESSLEGLQAEQNKPFSSVETATVARERALAELMTRPLDIASGDFGKADAAAENAFSYDAGGYNSNNPSDRSIDIAQKTMAATGLNRMDPNNEEQQRVAQQIARDQAVQQQVDRANAAAALSDPALDYTDIPDTVGPEQDVTESGEGADTAGGGLDYSDDDFSDF